MRGEIEKVATFLNKSPTEEQLDKVTDLLKFDNFEKNESVNLNEALMKRGVLNSDGKFMRKGWFYGLRINCPYILNCFVECRENGRLEKSP